MRAFLIFVEADIKHCYQIEIVILYSANGFEEACRASARVRRLLEMGVDSGIRQVAPDPSPLFPVYMTIP